MSEEMQMLIDICHSNLKNSKECLQYVKNRNISEESIEKYKLGFFPQNTAVLKKYISEDFLVKSTIMNMSGYSDYSNHYHLIFPILNEYKEPIAIIGRTLLSDDERSALGLSKYKNTSFAKSKYLYGLEHSRGEILKKQNVYVVEGNIDTISMNANDIKNVVGICGSAFSRHHLYKLTRYTDMMTFLLDNDSAGNISMERIYKKFGNKGVKFRFCYLPAYAKDVDEYFSKYKKTKDDFIAELNTYMPTW